MPRSFLGELDLMVLLALIRLGDEAYGVPIAREIEASVRRSISLGSVYATLDRFEERGLVKSRIGEPTAERGGRAKRYFAITAQGMREVRETQRTLVSLWKAIPELKGGLA
jgi:PadR family transcriptional regulator PadR